MAWRWVTSVINRSACLLFGSAARASSRLFSAAGMLPVKNACRARSMSLETGTSGFDRATRGGVSPFALAPEDEDAAAGLAADVLGGGEPGAGASVAGVGGTSTVHPASESRTRARKRRW